VIDAVSEWPMLRIQKKESVFFRKEQWFL